MTRAVLLHLSRSPRAQRLVSEWGFARRAARRFVAGETLDEAVAAVRAVNRQGIDATLDYLGENVRSAEEARACAAEYVRLLDRIAAEGLRSHASLKPTQMGLDLGEDLCLENLARVIERARAHGNFVRLDMESSAYTDRTLRLFERLRGGYEKVGPVLQSCLYRTAGDLERLLRRRVNVRLCKGAYSEPPAAAYPRKRDVDRNYLRLAERLLRAAAEGKAYAALATHDGRIVRWARRAAARLRLERDAFEFQMLYGVRRDLQARLARRGHRVRLYVSYGTHWFPYFMRRLAERPANVLFVLRNLLR
jgi:proline dehydrogenase